MEETFLSLVFVASGVLLIALAVPLIRRKVRPNRLYGFRTPSTMGDERIWYEVNAATGVDLLTTGIGLLLLSLVHALGLYSAIVLALASGVWLTLGALWSTIHGFAVINRMKADPGRR